MLPSTPICKYRTWPHYIYIGHMIIEQMLPTRVLSNLPCQLCVVNPMLSNLCCQMCVLSNLSCQFCVVNPMLSNLCCQICVVKCVLSNLSCQVCVANPMLSNLCFQICVFWWCWCGVLCWSTAGGMELLDCMGWEPPPAKLQNMPPKHKNCNLAGGSLKRAHDDLTGQNPQA